MQWTARTRSLPFLLALLLNFFLLAAEGAVVAITVAPRVVVVPLTPVIVVLGTPDGLVALGLWQHGPPAFAVGPLHAALALALVLFGTPVLVFILTALRRRASIPQLAVAILVLGAKDDVRAVVLAAVIVRIILAPIIHIPGAEAFLAPVTLWRRARRAAALATPVIPDPVIIAFAPLLPSAVFHVASTLAPAREEHHISHLLAGECRHSRHRQGGHGEESLDEHDAFLFQSRENLEKPVLCM